ncbi:aminoglycoside phosphotransferase [Microbacterium sp. Root61]|uniref:phosphotransferase n=1 Tax=Microbacterium sp. Root61 TaxID=1736570 RepID=UPI0006F3ECE9|nr:phosphotransferase [Microbacterium sp. Root61]KRA23834.1 aminoglycoside phosphotransferase [Microbacterium sp. Root61]
MDDERALEGGNATDAVVRIGTTVRKPWTASTAAVNDYVRLLRARGVDAPAPLGRDEQGRRIIEFIDGRPAMETMPLAVTDFARIGGMIRRIHDASEGIEIRTDAAWDTLIPVADADLLCHNDLAPWNLIMGPRWVFIDWDGAGPSTRLWDLAYAAQAFTLNDVSEPPPAAGDRLAALVDGYGADAEMRIALPAAMAQRAQAMHDLLRASDASGREPWGSMYRSGHGEHWRTAAAYVAQHARVWATALA